jgi:hypothetical protein
MAREIRGVSPSGTLYARILNPAGLWWNGTTFAAYSAAAYSTYVVAMTEQGASTVYVADFPTAITTGGTYEVFIHRTSASAAEGDIVVNTNKIDWTGSSAITAATGAMTGSDWLAYVLRLGFKRTDKDTEVYEATTDAIQEMRRRFMFDEAEIEMTTTDTITVAGDYKINVESDFGLVLGVILEDDNTGTPLRKISKAEFDMIYPGIHVDNSSGYPRDYCIYAGQILIGPFPDQTTYVYRVSYSQRAGTVTSSTSGVPFTNVYRDVLADLVLSRLYLMLEEFEQGNLYRQNFENGFELATRKERINSGQSFFVHRGFSL